MFTSYTVENENLEDLLISSYCLIGGGMILIKFANINMTQLYRQSSSGVAEC